MRRLSVSQTKKPKASPGILSAYSLKRAAVTAGLESTSLSEKVEKRIQEQLRAGKGIQQGCPRARRKHRHRAARCGQYRAPGATANRPRNCTAYTVCGPELRCRWRGRVRATSATEACSNSPRPALHLSSAQEPRRNRRRKPVDSFPTT
jgi:hypothetical protein